MPGGRRPVDRPATTQGLTRTLKDFDPAEVEALRQTLVARLKAPAHDLPADEAWLTRRGQGG